MQEKRLGPQYDTISTELAVVEGLVVRGARIVVPSTLWHHKDKGVPLHQSVVPRVGQNGRGTYPALPPMPPMPSRV